MSNCLCHIAEISLYTPRAVKGEKKDCGYQDDASGKGTCCQDRLSECSPHGWKGELTLLLH